LSIKDTGKRGLKQIGYEMRRLQTPGSWLRPTADQDSVLRDFKARGFAPSVIFDIGASDGWWTNQVRPIFPDAKFVLVEPRQTSAAGAIRAAVGARAGTGTLTDWDTGSTLLAVDPQGAPQIPVPVVTLDQLAQQHGMPDFVKLDVEGYEIEALEGAQTLFGRTELFQIEVALYRFTERPVFHEVVAYLAARDYYVYDIAGFIRRPYDGAIGLMDLCFARTLRGPEREWARR
jgi:FkbM family methyltransferase